MDVVAEKKAGKNWPGLHIMSLDLRSLALLRICYGALIFCDTCVRWTDLRAFYSDFGVITRSQILELGWHPYWFSIHMAVGHMRWLHLLFLLQALFTIALMLGWRTRMMTFLTWLFLISLHARNPMVLNGGDIYLRVILFWMMFLPWGHRWSLDALKGKGDHRSWLPSVSDNLLRGVAPIGLAIQICSVYWFAAIPKNDPAWTVTYDATMLVLKVDQFVTPLGYWFGETFAPYLAFLTFLVIWWEMLGPFLLLFPFDRGQVRTVAIIAMIGMHIGFGTMMRLGFFAWIGVISILGLLPSWFWDVPLRRFSDWADARLGKSAPAESGKWSVRFRELFFVLIVVYCFCWNCANEKITPDFIRVPQGLTWIGHATRLDQRWNMFSPGPFTQDGWYVIEGRFKDGRKLDLFANGKEFTLEKPEEVSLTYKNQRWRKYMMNLWLVENERYRLPFGQYLCRVWNKGVKDEEALAEFDLVYMLETTRMDGTEHKPVRHNIWTHWCFDKTPPIIQKHDQLIPVGGLETPKPVQSPTASPTPAEGE